ncbi:MAG: hypothetical protein ABIG95_04055 [Candidatus Woesearchaeota archaeon]
MVKLRINIRTPETYRTTLGSVHVHHGTGLGADSVIVYETLRSHSFLIPRRYGRVRHPGGRFEPVVVREADGRKFLYLTVDNVLGTSYVELNVADDSSRRVFELPAEIDESECAGDLEVRVGWDGSRNLVTIMNRICPLSRESSGCEPRGWVCACEVI